jgi:hypothetical protein
VLAHPGLYQGALRAPDRTDSQLTRAADEIVELCLAVIRAYDLPRRDALHALRGLRSAVHGFATLEAAGGFGIRLDLDRSFAWLVQCCINGLRSGPSRIRTRRA